MTIMADRAEMVLRSTHRHNLLTRSQCLRWLGSHFRVVLEATDHRTDYQVCPPPSPPTQCVRTRVRLLASASAPQITIRGKFAVPTP